VIVTFFTSDEHQIWIQLIIVNYNHPMLVALLPPFRFITKHPKTFLVKWPRACFCFPTAHLHQLSNYKYQMSFLQRTSSDVNYFFRKTLFLLLLTNKHTFHNDAQIEVMYLTDLKCQQRKRRLAFVKMKKDPYAHIGCRCRMQLLIGKSCHSSSAANNSV
jgi:hypothetical protein